MNVDEEKTTLVRSKTKRNNELDGGVLEVASNTSIERIFKTR